MMETYYEQRATAGLIISEGVVVSSRATGYINVPGIYTDAQVEAWAKITARVHEKGGRIFAQIWHVGRLSHPDVIGGELPLAPSAINPDFFAFTKNGQVDTIVPRAMTLADIRDTVADFRTAARNAVAAGFDGVELHAANGYLIHQFLAPSANRRDDNYGGGLENRSRVLFEVIEAVSGAIGSGRVGVRLNPVMDAAGIVSDATLEHDFEEVMTRMSALGLAYLHLAALTMSRPTSVEETLRMGRRYRGSFRGTLILNGALSQADAEAAIGEGTADLATRLAWHPRRRPPCIHHPPRPDPSRPRAHRSSGRGLSAGSLIHAPRLGRSADRRGLKASRFCDS